MDTIRVRALCFRIVHRAKRIQTLCKRHSEQVAEFADTIQLIDAELAIVLAGIEDAYWNLIEKEN